MRVIRDAHQSMCARKRYAASRKLIPKLTRKKQLMAERRGEAELYWFKTAGLSDEFVIGEQSGLGKLGLDVLKGVGSLVGAFSAIKLAGAATRASKAAERTASSLDELMVNIRKRVDEFVAFAKEKVGLWWLVPVGVLFYALLRQFGTIPIVGIALTALITGALGHVWPKLAKFFSPIQEQSEGELPALVATAACMCMFPKGKSPEAVADILMRRAGGFNRSVEGFQSIFKFAMQYAEKLVNVFRRMLSKDELYFTGQTDRLMRAWMSKVDAFEKKCVSGNPSLEELRAALDLQVEGIGFRQVLRVPGTIVACNKYLERLGVLLQAHKGALDASNSFRAQPTFVCFGGGSATGKTSALKVMGTMTLLIAGEVSAQDAMSNLWQKGSTEYWNGYVGQRCLIMDDCFQNKPQAGQEDNEYMQVIRTIGNWACPLNFADIESKGRFYFNSPLVIGTTNAKNVDILAGSVLNCPEAVVRRIQFGYWIEVHDDWKRGGVFDYARVESEYARRMAELPDGATQEQVIAAYPWEAWKVYRHDFKSEPNTGVAPLSMRDVMYEVAADIRNKKAAHSESTELLMNWLKKAEGAFPAQVAVQGDVSRPVPEIVPQAGFDPDAPSGSRRREPNPVLEQLNRDLEIRRADERVLREARLIAEAPPEFFNELRREQRERWERDRAAAIRQYERETTSFWGLILDFALGAIDTFVEWFRSPPEVGIMRQVRAAENPLEALWNVSVVLAEYWYWVLQRIGTLSICFIVAKEIMKFCSSMFNHMFRRGKKNRRGKDQSNIKEGAAKSKVKKDFVFKDVANAQLGCPPEDVQQNKIYENTYKLTIGELDDPDVQVAGQVLFVQGTVCMMPMHFAVKIRNLAPDTVLVFNHVLRPALTLRMSAGAFNAFPTTSVHEDVDLVFVKFAPSTIRAHWNCVPYFLTKPMLSDFLRVKNVKTRLDIAEIVKPSFKGGSSYISRKTLMPPGIEYRESISVLGCARTMVVEYAAQTVEGDCGAPLCIAESRTYNGCLIGVHTAGTTGWYQRYGFATYTTKEMVMQAIKALDAYSDELEADAVRRGITISPIDAVDQSGIVGPGLLVDGSFDLIGKVSPPLSVGTKSAIRPTPLYFDEVFGKCPTAPAVLRPITNGDGETVRPMIKGLQAYQSPQEVREIPLIDGIVRLATQKHREETEHCMREVLTPEEAVLGIAGLKLKKIARDTSPGYPYRLVHKDGKKDFFGRGEDYELTSDAWYALRERVLYVVEQAKRNVRLCHIFTDFLKDELRSLKKVREVATRVISGAPLDYVIAVRMYFGAFLAAMFSSHTASGMAPGINHYTEWHRIANLLLTRGKKVFGGDFSRFDASEQPYLHMKILEYINDWYARFNVHVSEDDRVREVLWMDLIHSRHLTGDGNTLEYLVQWNKSLPSGHPLTTPVNSLYSLITLTACYVHTTGDLTDMWEKAFIVTFGDDNVNSAHDSVAELFNQVTVSEKMKELFNLDYTSDKKGADLVAYGSIEEVTFLKRSFLRDHDIGSGGWVAPLALDSFLYVAYWSRNKRNEKGDVLNNLQNSLGEMSLHPPSVWDTYFPMLSEWAERVDFGLLPFTKRQEARDWVSTRTDVWF